MRGALGLVIVTLWGCTSTQISEEGARPGSMGSFSGENCGGQGQRCCSWGCESVGECIDNICQAPACVNHLKSNGYCHYDNVPIPCCDPGFSCSQETHYCQPLTNCSVVGDVCYVTSECCTGAYCSVFQCRANDEACVPPGESCDPSKRGSDCCTINNSGLSNCINGKCSKCQRGIRV
jgi:hypothetical protein